jgi:hypothetical protein
MTAATVGTSWLLAIPFAVVGVALLATGAVLLRQRIVARLRGALVDAEVVRRDLHRVPVAVKRAPDGQGASTFTPWFRYRDANGREHVARLDHQIRNRLRSERYRLCYPIGARTRVRIDPERPDVAYDDTHGWMLVFPGLLVLGGLLTTLLALGIFFG